MKAKEYEDGIAFYNFGKEVAFYSYICDEIRLYPRTRLDKYSGCSTFSKEDLSFIIEKINQSEVLK